MGGAGPWGLESAVRGRVVRDPETLERVGRDASHLRSRPAAVVYPSDPTDVRRLIRWARGRRVPLVPRGGGTSLDGESVPPDGGVVIDLSEWDAVEAIAPDERTAQVEPGVINLALQRRLAQFGLFYPPNPGSWARSTIGGNIGTNASGPRSFRYGPTRAWIRSLDVVLGNGRAVRLGRATAKRSVGPDLLNLLVGSEGTLGIVTDVTVRLARRPPVRLGLVVPLPPRASLATLAARLARSPVDGLAAVEYVDRSTAEALSSEGTPIGPPGSAWLLLEVEADEAREAEGRAERLAVVLARCGVTARAERFPDADELWSRRGASGDALDRRLGFRIREDVAVPIGRIDALVARLRRIARAESVPLYLFGHLGEGSLHPNFAVRPDGPTGGRVRSATLGAALALGGTVSAEHGIGRLKRSFAARELGRDAVDWLWAVKSWCDPDGILNPGALLEPRRPPRGSSRSPSASRRS